MIEKIKSYQDLNIWKEGIGLVTDIYQITKQFPKEETYGLISQMRRSSVSIPSNAAEGFRRFYNKEYKQFLYILLGSCAELETQITISKELNYIDSSAKDKLLNRTDYICRMTTNLIKKL